MKQIEIRFERDEALDHVDVLVRAPERDEQVRELMERIAAPQRMLTATGKNGSVFRFEPDKVVSISAMGKHTEIVTEDERVTVRQTLSELEEQLRGGSFIRIARHEIVNLSKIRKYDFTLAGTLRLEFADGMETWASRRCIPAIRRHLNGKEAQGK